MTHYGRSAWTSASNRAVGFKRSQVHVTWHYPGFGNPTLETGGWSLERCFRQLRAWRNMHVGSGAYREVAYNLYALPTGDVVDGRGNRQNGANGKTTANRAGLSIQVLIGDNETPTAGHRKAMAHALQIVEDWHAGISRRQYPHSHWVSTRCPGPKVRSGIPYSASGGGGSSPGSPGKAWTTSPRVNGFSESEVREIQGVLLGFDLDLGSYGQDGSYGDDTGEAVQTLQKELHVTPVDGIYGPGTEQAVMTIREDIDYIRRVTVRTQEKIDEGRDELDWVRRVTEVNQRRIGETIDQTAHITRDGKPVSLRQELADAKTIGIANSGSLADIEKALADANVDTTVPARED